MNAESKELQSPSSSSSTEKFHSSSNNEGNETMNVQAKSDNIVPIKSANSSSSVLIGQLPEDFLRLDCSETNLDSNQSSSNQIELDQALAMSLQQQYNQQANSNRVEYWTSRYRAYLSITFVEARLVKNYGLINMNLYVRLRVGDTIYETRTSNRGGKNPKWGETCRCYIPVGVDAVAIEIYDDCLFTQDELIAWSTYKLSENFLQFSNQTEHTFEERVLLSGKQGEGVEGELFLACNTKPITPETMRTYITTPIYGNNSSATPMVLAGPPILTSPIIVHQSTMPANQLLPPQPPQQPLQIRQEDIKTLQEMFSNQETDLIETILVAERGNLDRAITKLLELNSE